MHKLCIIGSPVLRSSFMRYKIEIDTQHILSALSAKSQVLIFEKWSEENCSLYKWTCTCTNTHTLRLSWLILHGVTNDIVARNNSIYTDYISRVWHRLFALNSMVTKKKSIIYVTLFEHSSVRIYRSKNKYSDNSHSKQENTTRLLQAISTETTNLILLFSKHCCFVFCWGFFFFFEGGFRLKKMHRSLQERRYKANYNLKKPKSHPHYITNTTL